MCVRVSVCVHVVCEGKGLCMLTKEDCRQRAPLDGDIVYNTLTVLINNVARHDDHGQSMHLLTYLLSIARARFMQIQVVLSKSRVASIMHIRLCRNFSRRCVDACSSLIVLS